MQIERFIVRFAWSCCGVALALCSALVQAANPRPVIVPAPPQVAAKSHLLMDAVTGYVIAEQHADELLPPASLTKMMTSYIVSEEIARGDLKEDDKVLITDDAWRRGGATSGGSTMFLNPRSEVPVIDLMRGIIIQSGNDASIAIAQHLAGSEDAFADVMNQHADLMGMNSTNFLNATGLPKEGHLTTARDLSILARATINDHPEHYAIYSEQYFSYNGINQPNRNRLLFRDSSVDGLKTGHTEEAGFCLVASAKKQGMRLISVVMGTRSDEARAVETQKLLSYGFRYYQTHTLYRSGQALATPRVWKGIEDEVSLGIAEDAQVTIPRGSADKLKAQTHIDNQIEAPIAEGQILGQLVVSLEGKELYKADLVAQGVVGQAGFLARLWDALMLLIQGILK